MPRKCRIITFFYYVMLTKPLTFSALIISLGLGTTIVFAGKHLLLAWIGLVINSFCILPLMTFKGNPRATEAAVKYALVQIAAGSIMILAVTINASTVGSWDFDILSNPFAVLVLIVALALKLGLAPLHFWIPGVLQGLDLKTGLLVATWQKLAPFALLLYISHDCAIFIVFLGVTSAVVAMFGGILNTQIRKIIAYSSIGHLGWIALILQFNYRLALVGIAIYVILTTATFLLLNRDKNSILTVAALAWMENPIFIALGPFILLSLAGIPPLTGFIPKFLITFELVTQIQLFLALVMTYASVFITYFYFRIGYLVTLMKIPAFSSGALRWRKKGKSGPTLFAIFTLGSLILLPLTPAVAAIAYYW